MHDILSDLQQWQEAGTTFALATVVSTSSSAPRPAGAALALHPDGTVIGSVSGGCVEAEVVAACEGVLAGCAPRTLTFGYSDDDAFSVGLTCGGTITVFVQLVTASAGVDLTAITESVERRHPVAVVTVIDSSTTCQIARQILVWPDTTDSHLGNPGLDAAVVDETRGLLAQGASGLRTFDADGKRCSDQITVFVESFAPRPRMLVFGATNVAAAISEVGRFLGFHVTVCDARAVFSTPTRFPQAHEVITEWPHRYLAKTEVDSRTVICVLTHDPKFDEPVLMEALRTPACYIGVLGSRRTHNDRLARLREHGAHETELARLRSPIGLDLGGRTPEETAISIAAEIVQERWGGSGQPLRHCAGPIHARPPAETQPALAV